MSELDRDFVIDQLERAVSKTKILRNDIMIVCPFHPDNNPSCSVHISGHKRPVGTYHCWSCGAKGPWGRLAEKLGLDSGEYFHSENPFGAKARALERREEEDRELRRGMFANHLPLGCSPWEHGGFRELPEPFLVKVGALRYYDDTSDCYRIVFPVKNRIGVIIGSAARSLEKSGKPWLNAPGPWASKALYPIELLPKNAETVVLVEGPYDALRLNYYGIPALSILGTQNWTSRKISILDACGIKSIVICMDGDPPGRTAEGQIFAHTEGKLKRKRFRLPFENPPVDPGNMSMERIEALMEFLGPQEAARTAALIKGDC